MSISLLSSPDLAVARDAAAAPHAAPYMAPYTVLRSHCTMHVRKDGSHTRQVFLDTRIDTELGVDLMGQSEVDFNQSLEDVKVLEAYTLLPDGTRIDVAPDKIRLQDERGSSDSIYNDMRSWVIIFPQVSVGVRVVYRYEAHQHTPEFAGHFSGIDHFIPHINYEAVTLEIQADPGLDLRPWTRGVQGGAVPAEPGDAPGTQRFRFSFSQKAQHAPEPGMVALPQVAPGAALSSFTTYAQVAQAYQREARAKAEPTDTIRTLARELTAAHPSTHDKVRVLYEWVSRHIRYVGVHVGTGGFVPHDAGSVLANRYGDCKDHVVLLEAMLRAVGIESSAALVNSGALHELPALPTPFAFNHAITYVPELDLFLDATAEFAPMGVLPAAVLGQSALLAATGELKPIARKDLSRAFTETHIQMELMPDGTVKGRTRMWMHGSYEPDARSEHAYMQKKPTERAVSVWLSRFLEAGSGHIEHPDPRDLRTPWHVDTRFELEPVVNIPGPSALALPVGLSAGNIRDTVRQPVYLGRQKPRTCSPHRHVEVITLDLPAGLAMNSIPQDTDIARSVYRYTARYRRTDRGLQVRRELVIDHPTRVCTPETDRQWHEVQQAIKRDLRSQVFIH